MHVNSFMLAQIVKLYSSLKKEIVVCIALMELSHVLLYRRTIVVVKKIKASGLRLNALINSQTQLLIQSQPHPSHVFTFLCA